MSTSSERAVGLDRTSSSDRSAAAGRLPTAVVLLAVVLVALAARLVPVLRGGGLHGLGNYDDAVHFAASVGLVNGRLPYRDFLLLQPPGILLLLSPFAALGQLVGDPAAFAVARLAWMALGAGTAAMVVALLRRLGTTAMLVGGMAYALFFPIAYVERTTLLEGPQNTLLVVAILLLATPATLAPAGPFPFRPSPAAVRSWLGSLSTGGDPGAGSGMLRPLLAGCALGLVVTIKIWGVATVLVVVVWLLLGRRRREAVITFLAAVGVTALVYLVFFVQAPLTMWQMVVTDQLGRVWSGTVSTRLAIATGLSPTGSGRVIPALLVLALLVLLAAMALAVRSVLGRLAVGLYLVFLTVLLATPSPFLHYGALLGAPTALILGTAVGALAGARPTRADPTVTHPTAPRRPVWRRVLTAVVAIGLIAGTGWYQPQSTTGSRFPVSAKLRRVVAATPGCVTFDDPGPALELDVVRRNLARGCPLTVDLGGRSYHPPMISAKARADNRLWQAYALRYLRSGDLALIYRFRRTGGFSDATRAAVRAWRLAAHSGPVDARRPPGH